MRILILLLLIGFTFCAQKGGDTSKDGLEQNLNSVLGNKSLRKYIVWLDLYNNQYNCPKTYSENEKIKIQMALIEAEKALATGRTKRSASILENSLKKLKKLNRTKKKVPSIRFHEVISGVHRMGWPTVSQLKTLRNEGKCDVLLNLTFACRNIVKTQEQRDYCEYVKSKSFEYVEIPISHIPKTNQVQRSYFNALNIISYNKKKGKDVCFHCTLGAHRSGLLSMLVEAAHGKEERLIFENYYKTTQEDGCFHSAIYPLLFKVLTSHSDFKIAKKDFK